MNQTPDQYAVVGNPIAHSKSPEIHAEFAKNTQQNIRYSKQLVPLDGFVKHVNKFFEAGGKGLNVTVPFKEDAFHYANQLTERAQAARAVNTLKKQDDGSILGDNTDGAGLVFDLTEKYKWPLANKNILLLGAGGAVRGVILPLLTAQPANLVIANRTASKAYALAKQFSENLQQDQFKSTKLIGCGFDEIMHLLSQENTLTTCDIIINGTSASLGADRPAIPESCIAENSHCYDMVYGSEPTAFMQWAQSLGCAAVADGSGMLKAQAAESFYVWRGVRPAW